MKHIVHDIDPSVEELRKSTNAIPIVGETGSLKSNIL